MMRGFSIDVPIVQGATLVEASAGTGKTWSIARLVARMLAEDPPEGGPPPTVDQVLVATFTDAAAAELRDRVRNVLAEAADVLDAVRASGAEATMPEDPAYATMAGTSANGVWTPSPADALLVRAERLRRALLDFDRATLSTIHSFCQRVLKTLSLESGAAFDAELLKDTDPLVRDIVEDWYANHVVPMDDATFAWFRGVAKFDRDRLFAVAKSRVGNQGARFLPTPSDDWRARVQERCLRARELLARCEGPEGTELLALVVAWQSQGWLHGTPYKQAAEVWEALRGWLRSGAFAPREKASFTLGHLHEKRTGDAKKHSTPFPHPLAADLEAFGTFGLTADAVLHEVAEYADAQLQARLLQRGAITFDQLLARVAAGLRRPGLAEELRRTYRAALIDEFQDTDTIQWEIFRTIFLEDPSARLILIGDPKQAIYGFRGADIRVYAEACARVPVERRFTMTRNFRSDKPLIEAMNAVLGAREGLFLDDDIQYVEVSAKHGPRLFDQGSPVAPLTLRWFDSVALGLAEAPKAREDGEIPEPKLVGASAAAGRLPAVVARDIRRDLGRGWRIRDEDGDRAVEAGDFAVLTGTNREAAEVRDALLAEGVPAVIARSGSVFASEESLWLERWLRALGSDGKDAPARAVAITPLFGHSAIELIEARLAEDADASARWVRFKDHLAAQARTLGTSGFTAAFANLLYGAAPPDDRSALQRLSTLSTGERHLTNLRHLAELLDAAAQARRLGAVGLARWLADRRSRGDEAEGAEFRLDADGQTVKVVTMHKSKGLEYPIVYAPGLADGRVFRVRPGTSPPIRFHDASKRVVVDLRGFNGGHARDAHRELMEERQRLLYVALTRAEHRVVLYAGPTSGSAPGGGLPDQDYAQAPLAVLLHGVTADDRSGVQGRSGTALRAAAASFAPGHLPVEDVEPVSRASGDAIDGGEDPELAPTPFRAEGLDLLWRRESYTGIVGKRKGKLGAILRPEEEQGLDHDADNDASESEDESAEPTSEVSVAAAAGSDEPLTIPDPPDDVPEGAEDVPFRAFHSGAEAGKWVHAVFEHTSFTSGAPKRGGELSALVRTHGERAGFPKAGKDGLLIDALPRMLDTPLGAAVGGKRLRDIRDHERLDELKFDIAVGRGEGEQVRGRALMTALGAAREDDPMPAGYLEHVRSMNTRRLSGFLTGAIDLIFRTEVGDRVQWFVADYKTNTLGTRADGRLVRSAPDHYAQPWLQAEVARKHYYLQYALYLVALDRYLRTRLVDYDYDRDVGGALYLFVRGMVGAETAVVDGRVHGVFHDKPPKHVIEAVSNLLRGARA